MWPANCWPTAGAFDVEQASASGRSLTTAAGDAIDDVASEYPSTNLADNDSSVPVKKQFSLPAEDEPVEQSEQSGTLTYEGEGFTVEASFGEDSGLRSDTQLEVTEIRENGNKAEREDYKDYLDRSEEALDAKAMSARFFDIMFLQDGIEVEPQGDVQVTIDVDDKPDYSEAQAIHLPEDEDAEVVDTSEEGSAVSFTADSFSVYGIVYTVDFHYDLDGTTIDYSIPGGSAISLKVLLPILGVCTNDEAETFVSEGITDVEFSDESLLVPAKVEQDITLKALKKQLELEGENLDQSGDTSGDEILINDETIKAVDWVLISLQPFQTEETLTITMYDGQVFTINVTDLIDPLGLEDRTFSIVSEYNGTPRSLESTSGQTAGFHYLNGRTVTTTEKNGVVYCDKEARAWLIEYDINYLPEGQPSQDRYYISDGYNSQNGRYLHYNSGTDTSGNGYWEMVSGAENATPIQIEKDDNGKYHFSDGNGHYLVRDGGGDQVGNTNDNFSAGTTKGDLTALTLCIPEDSGSNASHKATMISAGDLQQGQSVVIYQKVPQADHTYKYYAIDGDGNMVEVLNSSDSVFWRGDKSLEWKLTEATDDQGNLTGYFYFYNETTDKYLAPKGNGTVVQDLSTFGGDMDDVSISLPGRRAGTYASAIANWDYDWSVTSGLEVVSGSSGVVVNSIEFLDSQEFCFAVRDPIVQGQLTEVDTLDSDSMGVKMTMYDFNGNGFNGRLHYMNSVIGTEQWNERVYRPGIMSPVLVDGWPVSINTGQSLSKVFVNPTPGSGQTFTVNRTQPNANHLFIENVYESTGYFRYSAFENYAYLPPNSADFKVYEQIGSPARQGDSDYNSYYMRRGNFFPYDDLDVTTVRQNEIRPESNQTLPTTDPRYQEDLYATTGKNYWFGMVMETSFEQGPGGYNDRNDPMRFDFNGDDDMWVYIDNVLILDIGGVHDAFHGYIDFTTGEIHVDKQNTNTDDADTTIKQRYKDVGLFPDNTPWDDSRVDEYFDGETFKDYSTHALKMFYMERGAGASNLQMQFNLPVLTDDMFRVTKQMPTTATGGNILNDYADAQFLYRAYVTDENGTKRRIKQTDFANPDDENPTKPIAKNEDGSPIVWYDEDGDGVGDAFVLKPGQTAQFPTNNSMTKYYVEEFEPASAHVHLLDSYAVENSDPETNPAQASTGQLVTKETTVRKRGHVFFRNKPKEHMVNELQIKKQLKGQMYRDKNGNLINATQTGNPYFEYRIYLERTDGTLVPFSLGEYYILDKDGKYVYYERGVRQTMDFNVAVDENGAKRYFYNGSSTGETKPRITEHTSENGSIGDIRPGDTVYIPGLLVGTDFAVVERVDRSNIYEEGKGVEDGKNEKTYVFEGTEKTGAYDRETGENEPPYMDETGGLFDPPTNRVDSTADDYLSLDPRTAIGTIVPDMDAKVLVKNSATVDDLPVLVEKSWLGIDDDDEALEDAKIKVTLGRYVLKDKAGTLTIKKTGVGNAAFAATYVVKNAGGDVIAKIPYTADLEDGRTINVPPGSYTVTEQIIWQDPGYDWNHSPASSVESPAVWGPQEIADTGSATATFSCNPVVKTGSLKITSSYTIPQGGGVDTSNVTYTVYTDETCTTPAKKADGTPIDPITFAQASAPGGFTIDGLKVGDYTVQETGMPAASTDGNYTLEDHATTVTAAVAENQVATAAFTATYSVSAIPVIVHFGHSPNSDSGWSQDNTYTQMVPAGSTIVVPFSIRNCPYYGAAYPYYYNDDGSTVSESTLGNYAARRGEVTASTGSDSGSVTRNSPAITIPSNATEFHIYIKSRCDNGGWAPSIDGSISVTRSIGTRSAPRMLASKAPLRAGEGGDDPDEPTIDYGVTPTPATGKKYVVDMMDDPEHEGEMIPYAFELELTQDEINSLILGDEHATWLWDSLTANAHLPEADDDGNLYYYYIKEVTEEGVGIDHVTTVKLDKEAREGHNVDTEFLVGKDKHMKEVVVDASTTPPTTKLVPEPLEVINTGLADLTVLKDWTDDEGDEAVDHSQDTVEYKVYRSAYYMAEEDNPDYGNPEYPDATPTIMVRKDVPSETKEVTADSAYHEANPTTTVLVPSMEGYTGELHYYAPDSADADKCWTETVSTLPKASTYTLYPGTDDEKVVELLYDYYVKETSEFEGYKTSYEGGIIESGENEGDFTLTIVNEPMSPIDQTTQIDVQKKWKIPYDNDNDGVNDDDTNDHAGETLALKVKQTKYEAKVKVQLHGESGDTEVDLVPITINLIDKNGDASGVRVKHTAVVYVPQGASFSLFPHYEHMNEQRHTVTATGIEPPAGSNPPSTTQPNEPGVLYYYAGPDRSGVEFRIDNVDSPKEVTLQTYSGYDVWYDAQNNLNLYDYDHFKDHLSDAPQPGYRVWTCEMYSPEGIIWELDEMIHNITEGADGPAGLDPTSAGTQDYVYDMTFTQDNQGLHTNITPTGLAPGHGVGSDTVKWKGSIIGIPAYELKENADETKAYIYTYEIAEGAIGDDAVTVTSTQPGGSGTGETASYDVTWDQDRDGTWILTNTKKKPNVSLRKVDAEHGTVSGDGYAALNGDGHPNETCYHKLLEGATFTLKDSNGHYVKADGSDGGTELVDAVKLTTGANGLAVFNNLSVGTYTISEITPPVGYETIDDMTLTVSTGTPEVTVQGAEVGNFDSATNTYTITIADEALPTLPNAGFSDVFRNILIAIGILLLLCGAAILAKRYAGRKRGRYSIR